MSGEKKITEKLTALWGSDGFDALYEDPREVYEYLVKEKGTDRALCRAVAYALLFNVGRKGIRKKGSLKREINALSLNESMSDSLYEIFSSLYSETHLSALSEDKKKALDDFCSSEHTFKIWGEADWRSKKHYTLHCTYSYELTVSVSDRKKVEEYTVSLLEKLGSATSDDITDFFRKEIQNAVDDDFEEFCGEDEDYYEPYVEEYDGESGDGIIEDYLGEHGLELVESSFSGDTDSGW